MSIETEPTAGESIVNEAPASARKKTATAKPKGAPASKTRKAADRPPRPSRAKPNGEKLICRYCGRAREAERALEEVWLSRRRMPSENGELRPYLLTRRKWSAIPPP